jgi:ABC-type transport system involved in multi-copper enzyme maturation permease subunit
MMFWNTVIAEERKLFRRALLWIELGLMAGLVALLMFVQYVLVPAQGDGMPHDMTLAGELLSLPQLAAAPLGALIMVVLTGVVIAQDYAWRTLHLWVSHGTPRATLLGAKFVALLLPAFLIPLLALLVGGPIASYVVYRANGVLELSLAATGQIGLALLLAAYTLLPYTGLAFLLAVVSRAMIAPIAGGIVFILLIEGILTQVAGIVGGILADLASFLPINLASSVMTAQVTETATGLPTPAIAIVGIGLYTLALIGMALWVFHRQDLTG